MLAWPVGSVTVLTWFAIPWNKPLGIPMAEARAIRLCENSFIRRSGVFSKLF